MMYKFENNGGNANTVLDKKFKKKLSIKNNKEEFIIE